MLDLDGCFSSKKESSISVVTLFCGWVLSERALRPLFIGYHMIGNTKSFIRTLLRCCQQGLGGYNWDSSR